MDSKCFLKIFCFIQIEVEVRFLTRSRFFTHGLAHNGSEWDFAPLKEIVKKSASHRREDIVTECDMGSAGPLWIQKLQRDCPRTGCIRILDSKCFLKNFCFVEIEVEVRFLTRSFIHTRSRAGSRSGRMGWAICIDFHRF